MISYAEFIRLPVAEQLRIEAIATMCQDDEMTESEAIAIIEHQQLELMPEIDKIWYTGRDKKEKR